jgi:hypothetical protein
MPEEDINQDTKTIIPIHLILATFFWGMLIITITLNQFFKHDRSFNEWGDFFAGFFAPIVFLWIGYGIYIQRREFNNLREALVEQRKEYENTVQEQKNHIEQIKIQSLVNWFRKNTTLMRGFLDKLSISSGGAKYDSPIAINKNFNHPLQSNKFTNIFHTIKNIIDLDAYIIDEMKKKDELDCQYKIELESIKREYNSLFKEELLLCNDIYLKILLIVAVFKIEIAEGYGTVYQDYAVYKHWISDYNFKILEEFIKNQVCTIEADDTDTRMIDLQAHQSFNDILIRKLPIIKDQYE